MALSAKLIAQYVSYTYMYVYACVHVRLGFFLFDVTQYKKMEPIPDTINKVKNLRVDRSQALGKIPTTLLLSEHSNKINHNQNAFLMHCHHVQVQADRQK